MQTINASNGVRKLGHRQGKTIQVGDARLTWKATGADTGYTTSLYEMDLAPGSGIPVHSHPYAEVFYVVSGHVDFLRFDEKDHEEWVRCGPGDTVLAPINALHAFHNRTSEPCRFISSSVYYHEVLFNSYAVPVDIDAPAPERRKPSNEEADQYLQILKDAIKVDVYFPQANAKSGIEVLQEIESRNRNEASFAVGNNAL